MGCKGINNDSTEEYVDSYSKTALQQADIIMDGIQSGNCEEIADIFCPYIMQEVDLHLHFHRYSTETEFDLRQQDEALKEAGSRRPCRQSTAQRKRKNVEKTGTREEERKEKEEKKKKEKKICTAFKRLSTIFQ